MLSKFEIRNQSTDYADYTDFFKRSALARPAAGGTAIRNLACRQAGAIGFTLVELLVVIFIIALLVGMLLPSMGMVRKTAANTRTSARIAELAGGCNMYFTQNGYYPGQLTSPELKGSGGNFTGSQVLAACLFDDVVKDDSDVTHPHSFTYNNYNITLDGQIRNIRINQKPVPKAKYAPVKEDDLKVCDSVPNSISDRYTPGGVEPMALLYYPARLGVSGLGQYKEADNSDYTSGVTWKYPVDDVTAGQSDFEKYIKDRRFQGNGSTTPYAPGGFLIIAAGMDRLYGTKDDIRYPDFKSD